MEKGSESEWCFVMDKMGKLIIGLFIVLQLYWGTHHSKVFSTVYFETTVLEMTVTNTAKHL